MRSRNVMIKLDNSKIRSKIWLIISQGWKELSLNWRINWKYWAENLKTKRHPIKRSYGHKKLPIKRKLKLFSANLRLKRRELCKMKQQDSMINLPWKEQDWNQKLKKWRDKMMKFKISSILLLLTMINYLLWVLTSMPRLRGSKELWPMPRKTLRRQKLWRNMKGSMPLSKLKEKIMREWANSANIMRRFWVKWPEILSKSSITSTIKSEI